MRLVITGVLGLVLAGTAASAEAQSDDERARSHFLAGSSYFDQARYEEAAEQFKEAYALSPRPPLLLNVASAYERALRFDEAASYLEQYLELADDASDRTTVQQRLYRIRELAARHATRPEEAAAARDEPQASEADEAGDAAPSARGNEADGGGLGTLGLVGVITAGAGAALGIGAIATGVIAHGTYTDLEDRCGADGSACPAGSQADIDSGSTLATASTALTAVSLAAVATGAVLLILDLSEGEEEPPVAVQLGPENLGLFGTASF